MSQFLSPALTFFLFAFCLLPWFIFVPSGAPAWVLLLFLFVCDAKADLSEKQQKPVPDIYRFFSKTYFLVWMSLAGAFSYFLFSLHPVSVILLCGLTVFSWRIARPATSLHFLHGAFIFIIIYDAAISPKFQELPESKSVALRVPSGTVRNIFADDKEDFLYFTAYGRSEWKGVPYETFFRVSLKKRGKLQSLIYPFCYAGAYDKKRHLIFLLGRDTDELLVVSPDTMNVLRKTKIFRNPADIYMDEKRDRLIVLFEWRMAVYHPETLSPLGVYAAKRGANFVQGVVLKKRDTIALACFTVGGVQERSLKTCRIKRQLRFYLTPWAISTDSDEKLLYVTDFLRGTLSVLDAQSLRVVKSARVQSGIRPVEVDEKRGLLYVGSFLSPYLFVLDENLSVKKKVFVGNPCRDIKLLRNGRLFVGTRFGLVEIKVDNL